MNGLPTKAGTLLNPQTQGRGKALGHAPENTPQVTIRDHTSVAMEDEDEPGPSGMDNYMGSYMDLNSWHEIEEDEFGRLITTTSGSSKERERRRLLLNALNAKQVKRGMIRFVQVVIDLSRASTMTDFRPSRLAVISNELQNFIKLFFEQNPLSQLALIATRNGIAVPLTDLSGSPHNHIEKLKTNLEAYGDASLQNALQLAVKSLNYVPPYGHREVLIIFSALSTCDPGNVFDAIKSSAANNCRCSIIGLGAEVNVLSQLANMTKGKYSVATNEKHFRELLEDYAPPPPTLEDKTPSSLIKMGFPMQNDESVQAFVGVECQISSKSYTCPRCKARVKDLPCTCHICGLALVSSAHLARSYHHLFPVPLYVEVDAQKAKELKESAYECYACARNLKRSNMILECPSCSHFYCIECDIFIHETLHNCPSCCSMGQ